MNPNANPKVSVVTVCYNSAQLLEKTIASVAEQTYDNIEYIIVDGASTDGTLKLIEAKKQFIAKWISEPDGGIYDAMNKGTEMSSGEWIIFMNAGDTFHSANTVQDVFSRSYSPKTAVVYGHVNKLYDNGANSVVKKAEAPHNSHRMFFCHQCAFTRRSALLKFPFDTRHRMSADFKLYKTLFKNKLHFEKIDEIIANFDTDGVSNRYRSRGLADNIRVIRKLDSPLAQLKLLPRLIVPYVICRIKGK